jgi:hypothetical protein
MPTLQVRDLDERTYRALLRRAESEKRSLARQVAKMLEQELEPAGDRIRRLALLEEIRAHRTGWPAGLVAPVDLLREDRER